MHTSKNVRANGAGVNTLVLTFDLMLGALIIIGGIAFPQLLWPQGGDTWIQYITYSIIVYLAMRATRLQDYAKKWGLKMKETPQGARYAHFDDRVFVIFTVFLFLLAITTLSATIGNPVLNLIVLGLAVLFTFDFNTMNPQVPPPMEHKE